MAACFKELLVIGKKVHGSETFLAINQLAFQELLPPIITLCPAPAWKSQYPFLTEKELLENSFSWEEIFHPQTLTKLQNKSLFATTQIYSSFNGLCFEIEKLSPEKVSDYSFQMVINNSMDYYYYLHEKKENEYLFMNVYPYEVRLQYLDANNGDGIGGASIIYRKDMVKKLPGMGCQDATITGMNILSE